MLGCVSSPELPVDLLRSTCLHTFITDRNGQPFHDNKCAMRCLVLHELRKTDPKATKKTVGFEEAVEELRLRYCAAAEIAPEKSFTGVSLREMHHLEDVIRQNINIYRYVEPGSEETYDDEEDRRQQQSPEQNNIFLSAAIEGEENDPEYNSNDFETVIQDYEGSSQRMGGAGCVDSNRELWRHAYPDEEIEPDEDTRLNDELPQTRLPYFELVSFNFVVTIKYQSFNKTFSRLIAVCVVTKEVW